MTLQVWDGTTRNGRSNGLNNAAATGADWLRLVHEIQKLQRVCDGMGLTAASGFPVEDPAVTGQLFVGDSGEDEVQSLAAISSVSGNWKLKINFPDGQTFTTGNIAYNAAAAAIQTAIDTALADEKLYGVTYTADDLKATGGAINSEPVVLTFGGALGDMPFPLVQTINVDLSDETPPVASRTTAGLIDDGLTLATTTSAASYPNVWDGKTPVRQDVDAHRAPIWQDALELFFKIRALEARILPLEIAPGGAISPEVNANGGSLRVIMNSLGVNSGSPDPKTLWDGTSRTRTDIENKSAPDNWDFFEATKRLSALQSMIFPLGFDADGRLPTEDPGVAGQLWTSTGSVKVSLGA